MNLEKYDDFILMNVKIEYDDINGEISPSIIEENVFYIWKKPTNAATAIILSLAGNSSILLPNTSQNIKIGVIQSEFSKSIKIGEMLSWGALRYKLGTLVVNRIFPPFKKSIDVQPKTKTLYRPVNQDELNLIIETDYTEFPPRKKEQPFFYPVLNEEYASKIAKEWNAPAYGVGYVTKFNVREDYLSMYEIHNVGGEGIDEYWIPSEDLELFNICIVDKIEVIKKYENRI